MYSFSWLYIATFYIIDFNSFWKIHHLRVFPYKCIRTKVDHCMKKSNVNLETSLNKLGSIQVLNAVYQVSTKSANRFQTKRFLKVFPIWVKIVWTNFSPPISRRIYMKFDFDWSSSFWGEDVWKCWRSRNPNDLGQGQGTTLTSGTCMYSFSLQCMPTFTS